MNCIKCKAYITKEDAEIYDNYCAICYKIIHGLCVNCGKPLSIFHIEHGYEKCTQCYRREKELDNKI